ncbi:DNA/RNA non-specific endonuclease [Chitinophaga qingshengii]|uniref:DNA/RNA non-specific endonuclease n=1 Tax=Chitinophaga qingshengii TaxID=1569794 RepID=A0ABR7TUV5_9BACT|nr:DNA/RNA non-specific endonuclease [Chitinophaga qingshengii]MBC9934265.1 DNA/RNA non-specific endonuclease [Chitinophaga qingshengii]
MKFNFRLLATYTALLLIVACAKDDIRKSGPGTPGKPDTITVTPPTTNPDPGTVPGDNGHLLLGNPTEAQSNLVFIENFLMNQTYFMEAYSKNAGIPVWVSWHLQTEDCPGTVDRSNDFRPDPSLPQGWYQVSASSYNGSVSGFDRGHNCPSGDRTATKEANSSTFLMTNMIPQAAALNQVPWANMEDFIRQQVKNGNEAFIVMGAYGKGGRGKGQTEFIETLDQKNITVPKQVWKVVVIIPKGVNDLARVDANATVIAVDMPNDNDLYSGTGKTTAWKDYLCTVETLETKANAAGVPLNLFKNIPEGIRTQLKKKLYH